MIISRIVRNSGFEISYGTPVHVECIVQMRKLARLFVNVCKYNEAAELSKSSKTGKALEDSNFFRRRTIVAEEQAMLILTEISLPLCVDIFALRHGLNNSVLELTTEG